MLYDYTKVLLQKVKNVAFFYMKRFSPVTCCAGLAFIIFGFSTILVTILMVNVLVAMFNKCHFPHLISAASKRRLTTYTPPPPILLSQYL